MNQENLPFPTPGPAGPAVRDRKCAQRQQPNRLPEDGPYALIAVTDGAVPPSLSCGGDVRIDTLRRIDYEGMAATGSPDGDVPPTLASLHPGPHETAGQAPRRGSYKSPLVRRRAATVSR